MSVASLMYKINADTSSLSRELRFAERDVQRFSKRAESNVRKLGKAFGALGALGATAFIALTRDAINTGAELSIMSDRTGVAVEDLSALSWVAEQSGTSVDAMNEGIVRFNQNIIQAADGTGNAAEMLSRYNINLRDSDNNMRSQKDILLDVADAVANAGDTYEESAIAAELFGTRSGNQMLPMLKMGKDGIEEITAEAHRLGIVFEEDAATAARQLQDDVNVLRQGAKRLGMQFASGVIPALGGYINNAVEAGRETENLGNRTDWVNRQMIRLLRIVEGVRVTFDVAGKSIGVFAALVFDSVMAVVDNFRILGVRLGDFMKRVIGRDFAGAKKAFDGAGEEIDQAHQKRIDRMTLGWEGYKEDVVSIIEESAGRIAAAEEGIALDKKKVLEETAEDIRSTFDATAQDVDTSLQKIQQDMERRLQSLRSPIQEFADELAILDEALGLQVITDEEFDRLERRLIEALDPFGEFAEAARMESLHAEAERVIASINGIDLATQAHLDSLQELLDEGVIGWEDYRLAVDQAVGAIDQLEEKAEESGDMIRNVGEMFASSFVDFVVDPFGQSVEEMASGFIQQLTRMVVETAAQRAILAAFGGGSTATGFSGGGMVQSFATGGFVSGAGTATSDSIPAWLSDGEYVLNAATTSRIGKASLDAMNFGNAPGFARGGAVSGGRSGGGGSNVNVIVVQNMEQAMEEKLRRDGESLVIDTLAKNRGKARRALGDR